MKILVVLIFAVTVSTLFEFRKIDSRIKSINKRINNINLKIIELENKESAKKVEVPVTVDNSEKAQFIKIKSYKYK